MAASGSLTLSGAPSNQAEFGLQTAGDANNDNVINVLDFNIMKNTFGKSLGATGYDRRGDLNNDDVVNVLDFNLQKGNFGQSGAAFSCP